MTLDAAEDMNIKQVILACASAAILHLSPQPWALEPAGGYASPDPGWYNQGSTPRYQPSVDPHSDWYSSDWFSDQMDSPPARRSYWGSAGDRSSPAPSRDDRRPAYADPGYGSDDWARDPQAPLHLVPDRDAHPAQTHPRDRMPIGEGYDSSDPGSHWARPTPRPRYRFRDDPRLERQGPRRDDSGYRFRPLTKKELERRRRSADAMQPPGPEVDRRRDPSSARGTRGEAFGYQPEIPPGSFFERYYRSGP